MHTKGKFEIVPLPIFATYNGRGVFAVQFQSLFHKNPLSGCRDMAVSKFSNFNFSAIPLHNIPIGVTHAFALGGVS